MVDATYTPKVYLKRGGEELVVASGGKITVESGGEIDPAAGSTTTIAGDLHVDGNTVHDGTVEFNNSIQADGLALFFGETVIGHDCEFREADDQVMIPNNQFYRCAVATFTPKTTAAQRTIAAHGLGVWIPDNAIVTKAWYDVVEQPTSGTSTAKLILGVEAANDLVAELVITNAAWTAGIKATAATGAAAAMIKTTAKREITMEVTTEVLTAGGIINVFVEYMIST